MQQGGEDPRARATQRVSQSDRAAVRVDIGHAIGDAEVLDTGESLGGEGFVQFDDAQVVEGEARELSALRDAGAGPKPMISGGTPATA